MARKMETYIAFDRDTGTLDRDTGTLLSGEDRNDSDPFEEEEDEDQLEEIDDC